MKLHLFRMKIRKKIQLGFVIIIGLCVLLTLSFAYLELSRVVNTNVKTYSQQVADKTMQNIEYYLQDVNELARNMILDEQIVGLLGDMPRSGTNPDAQRRLDAVVKKYQYLQSYITDISILDERNKTFLNFDYDYKNTPFAEQWYIEYANFPSERYFTGLHPSIIRGSNVRSIDGFTYMARIYDLADPTQYLGTLAIELDANIFMQAVRQSNSGEGTEWSSVIFNENGHVMLQPEQGVDETLEQSLQWQKSPEQAQAEITINGVPMAAVYSQSDKFGWSMMSYTSKSGLTQPLTGVRWFILTLGAICFIVALVLAFVISRSITGPIKALMRNIQQIEKGNFDVELTIRSGDELEKLGNLLNRMSGNIKQLIERNRVEERLKRKAELTALQAQINPHFLYNTLESINWLAVRKKELAISEVLTNLGKFFRISLSRGASFISLRQELEHVKYYIEIQKFRYPHKFDADIRLESDIGECFLPKLLLQPLVENSLMHGLSERERDGRIEFYARRSEEALLIDIRDNGVGMDEERLKDIKGKLAGRLQTTDNRIYGLINVQERIKLAFGEAYGLSIDCDERGTEVRLMLPLLPEPPEE